MDYAIYKTLNGSAPRTIHRFTQADCNHRAMKAARAKLDDMRYHVIQRPAIFRNFAGSTKSFEYDHITSANTTDHIKFYISELR